MADKLYDNLMKLTEQGGAAFPFHTEVGDGSSIHWPGMTLRDYFAAMAVHGQAAGIHYNELPRLAESAYRLADAMLKARGNG